jgi:L-ascorbate metabolism protein UlaG (beta-lactamase superfamily)
VSLAAAVLAVATLAARCASVATPPPGAPAHHVDGGFRNLNPEFTRPPYWPRTWWVFGRLLRSTFRPRTADLPRVPNDGAALRANTREPTITWIGHATFLVQLDGLNILTDPIWSDRASPVSWGGPRRVTPPGLRFEDLPPIHLVLISHDHYDHLDLQTVARLAATHRPRFLVPLGLRAWFAAQGITEGVDELDWWESRRAGSLTVTCTPVQHWSARSWWDQNERLWSGWAVAGNAGRLFFAGDTGYYAPIFTEIGRRLGPFDVAAVAIGAYAPPFMMRLTHTTPEEALQIAADVRATTLAAMHWGTFDMTDEPLDEPPWRLREEATRRGLDADRVWIFRVGETRGQAFTSRPPDRAAGREGARTASGDGLTARGG